MRILIELSHPKHYYQFRQIIHRLEADGHSIKVIARDKDVLLRLLNEEKQTYTLYGQHGKNLFKKLFAVPALLITYYRIVKKIKPDIILSKASPYAVIISWLYSTKTIITPDSEVVNLTRYFVAPYSSVVITPRTFTINWESKHKYIKGFFEDCYLHPSVFYSSNHVFEILKIKEGSPYFILRFIAWKASHDVNQFGFSDSEKIKLVEKLQAYGTVFISAESELPGSLEKYRIRIPASLMHSALHFATLYIGDSQTMATEAALLGTPSIRYNSFVGANDMSNFKVLEEQYGLMKNCRHFSEVIYNAEMFLLREGNKEMWLQKRRNYYRAIGDINEQIISYMGVRQKSIINDL